MTRFRYPSVLTIAGFDGSGGAGIQADIKTISALGCYATSVLTALPVQNTTGVRAIYPIPAEAVAAQIEAILDDIFPDAVKIGMVHTPELADTIANILSRHSKIPVVFDPVMAATSGHRLAKAQTVGAITEKLFPVADIITPNMDEAGILSGIHVTTPDDMEKAALRIKQLGCRNILLKGGHLEAPEIVSLLIEEDGKRHTFKTQKLHTRNTHGSGCTLSSAIASFLALGNNLAAAVKLAQEYVYDAILNGMDVRTGMGNGPLNHFFNPRKPVRIEHL